MAPLTKQKNHCCHELSSVHASSMVPSLPATHTGSTTTLEGTQGGHVQFASDCPSMVCNLPQFDGLTQMNFLRLNQSTAWKHRAESGTTSTRVPVDGRKMP